MIEDLIIKRAVEDGIKILKKKLNEYEQVLKVLSNGSISNDITMKYKIKAEVEKKRKTRKGSSVSLKTLKRTKSPEWRVEIPKVLRKSGESMTSKEIVSAIFPDKNNSKSMRILNGRCSAILHIFVNNGFIKYGPKKDGKFNTYILSKDTV